MLPSFSCVAFFMLLLIDCEIKFAFVWRIDITPSVYPAGLFWVLILLVVCTLFAVESVYVLEL